MLILKFIFLVISIGFLTINLYQYADCRKSAAEHRAIFLASTMADEQEKLAKRHLKWVIIWIALSASWILNLVI